MPLAKLGFVAQLVEQLPLKQLVVGSSPTEPTKIEILNSNIEIQNKSKIQMFKFWVFNKLGFSASDLGFLKTIGV